MVRLTYMMADKGEFDGIFEAAKHLYELIACKDVDIPMQVVETCWINTPNGPIFWDEIWDYARENGWMEGGKWVAELDCQSA